MTDRDYIKLNTSIQTASNSDHLLSDGEGNVMAKIEMRLPDNLYTNDDPDRRITKVEMETTKMRLSMANVPIAQIPMDVPLSSTDPSLDASTCQLDVYPLCLTDNATLEPTIEPSTLSNLAFAKYKSHSVTYNIKFSLNWQNPYWYDLFSTTVIANTAGYGFPEGSKYYPVLSRAGLLDPLNHLMNLCAHSNHESIQYPDGQLLLKNIATLEQMLQDALENAVTFASTSDEQVINVYLLNMGSIHDVDDITPPPHPNNTMYIDEYDVTACFWYSETSTTTLTSDLNFGFKPTVRLSEQAFSIEYDTAPFSSIIPIIWNPAYVDTYDHPEQMMLDNLRKLVWAKPPPKRAYRYNMKVNEDLTYSFALAPSITCAVMNIIVNQAMKDTFSFLPWCKVDTTNLEAFRGITLGKYHVVDTKTRTNTVHRITKSCQITSTEAGRSMTVRTTTYATAPEGNPLLGRIEYSFASPTEISSGAEILDTELRSTFIGQSVTLYGDPGSSSSNAPTSVNYTPYDTPVDLPPEPTTTSIVQEYDTNTTMTPGTSTVIDRTNIDYGEAVKTTELADAEDIVLYSMARTPGGSTAYKVYGLPSAGTWLNNSMSWYLKMIPNVAPAEFTLTETVENYYIYKATWYTPNPTVISQYDGMNQPPFQITNTTQEQHTWNTTITREVTTNSNAPEDASPMLIPNFSRQTTLEPFYILDGTNAMVTISEPSPIMDNVIPGVTGSGDDESEQIAQGMKRAITTETTGQKQVSIKSRMVHDYSATDYVLYQGEFLIRLNGRLQYDDEEEDGHYFKVDSIDYVWDTQSLSPYPIADQRGASVIYGDTEWTNSTITIPDEPTTSTTYTRIELPLGTETFTQEGISHETVSIDQYIQLPARDVNSQLENVPPLNIFPPPFLYNYYLQGNTERYTAQPTPIYRGSAIFVHTGGLVGDNDVSWFGRTNSEVNMEEHIDDVIGFMPWQNTLVHVNNFDHGCSTRFYNSAIGSTGSGFIDLIVTWYHYTTEFVPSSDQPFVYFRKSYIEQADRGSQNASVNWGNYQIIDSIEQVQTSQSVAVRTQTKRTTRSLTTGGGVDGSGLSNTHIKFVWDELPIIVMSPLASIVLILDGMKVSQEIQPINATEAASNLTQSVAIIENYFPVVTTLRDLHDELIIARSEFDTAPRYLLDTEAGEARDIKLSAKFITKDGRLHDLYIPVNGTYSIQLTFRVSYYTYRA